MMPRPILGREYAHMTPRESCSAPAFPMAESEVLFIVVVEGLVVMAVWNHGMKDGLRWSVSDQVTA